MYIDISFYLRPDEGEVVSHFVKHFCSHSVTAFDTAFGKFPKRYRDLQTFRFPKRKATLNSGKQDEKHFKTCLSRNLQCLSFESCFLNLTKILPSHFADSPCRRTALLSALLWYMLLFCIRSSKNFWEGLMKKVKCVSWKQKETAVHFIICCSEDLVVILQTKVYVLWNFTLLLHFSTSSILFYATLLMWKEI